MSANNAVIAFNENLAGGLGICGCRGCVLGVVLRFLGQVYVGKVSRLGGL